MMSDNQVRGPSTQLVPRPALVPRAPAALPRASPTTRPSPPRYSSQSSANVTFGRRNSRCTPAQSGISRHSAATFGGGGYLPRSRENPELRWVNDTEIVGNLIAVLPPVPWHLIAWESRHRGAEVPEGRVAFVVGDVPVH